MPFRRIFDCCLLSAFLLMPGIMSAQGKGYQNRSRFKAGAMFGLNLSQVDGDKYYGFRRPGIEGGLMGIVVLDRSTILSTELLFSQRGSLPSYDELRKPANAHIRIRMNYVSVPVIFHFLVKERENGSFRNDYHIGLSFARLVSTRIREFSYPSFNTVSTQDALIKPDEPIKNNDISAIFGATYYFNRSFGLTLRGTFSMTPFYRPKNAIALSHYYLTLAGAYYLD